MDVQHVTADDRPTLDAWCVAHGKKPFPKGWLPPTGYWVPGVLAAFLYRTDSRVAYIECVISNPDTSKEERKSAMLAVGEAIAEHARGDGFLWLFGLTEYPTVADNARLKGYVVSEPKHSTLVLNLVQQ